MANTTTAITPRVSEAPVQNPIASALNLAPVWQRWFASVGSWISAANSVKTGTVGDGQYRIALVGRVASVTCTFTIGAGTNTYVGITLKPAMNTALVCSTSTISATLGTNGVLTTINSGPATNSNISGSVITAPTKEI